MSYTIQVLVPNATEPVIPTFSSSIILKSELDDEFFGRYYEIWPFFCSMGGILYSLVQDTGDEYYSSFPLCDSNFDSQLKDIPFPLEDDVLENLTVFYVKEEFLSDFLKMVHFLLTTAPDKRIMFHTRYEGGDREVILGVVKWKDFVKMLREQKVYFNICYIIEL